MERTVLVATSDPVVTDWGARWCAAVGVDAVPADSAVEVAQRWRTAAAVLLGDDLAPAVGRLGLPRRDHVVLVDPSGGPGRWRTAVASGAAAVCTAPDDPQALDVLGAALDGRGEAVVVSVVGAVGGVGSSTLAAGLAGEGARRGARALLLDLDPTAGGVDLLLGAERAEGVRWDALDRSGGRLSGEALLEVLPRHRDVGFLTWGRDVPVVEPVVPPVLEAASRSTDLVVADVARHPGPASEVVLARSVLTVVVVPDDLRGIAAAGHLVPLLTRRSGTVVALVRRAGTGLGFGSGGLGLSATAAQLDVPVLGQVRHDRRLPGAAARGLGPWRSRPVRRAAHTVLDLLGVTGDQG